MLHHTIWWYIQNNLEYLIQDTIGQVIHQFSGNDYVLFQEIWNDLGGVKKHIDFVNHNLRK